MPTIFQNQTSIYPPATRILCDLSENLPDFFIFIINKPHSVTPVVRRRFCEFIRGFRRFRGFFEKITELLSNDHCLLF